MLSPPSSEATPLLSHWTRLVQPSRTKGSYFPLLSLIVIFNTAALKKPAPPPELKGYTQEEYTKTQRYNLDKWRKSFVQGAFFQVLETCLLVYLYLPWLWDCSEALLAHFGYDHTHELKISIVFFLLDSLKDLVLSIPWNLFGTFVIEQRHGFNQSTLTIFVTDLVKQVLLGLVLGPPLVAAFTFILQSSGPYVGLYLWAFLLAVTLVFMLFYPAVARLFNRFDPLPSGSLRASIEDLAGSLTFPLSRLYVIDGSKRSAHSNAYFFGLFKKRIVLFDTLIDQCSEDEVVAVLAHELGHWSLSHTLKNLVIIQLHTLVSLGLFTLVRNSPGLFASFGFVRRWRRRPALIAFSLFNIISSPVDEVVSLLFNMLSRRFEFQADAFAVDLGHKQHLKEALRKLDAKNRSATYSDPLYSTLHYSHPPLVERLQAIDAAGKKSE